MAMHEYFYWTANVGDLWFKGFLIKSADHLVGACFLLFAIAFLFEFLKLVQVKIRKRQLLRNRRKILNLIEVSENEGLLTERNVPIQNQSAEPTVKIVTRKEKVQDFFIELLMFITNLNLIYFLMLAVMLFNGWMFISVLIGDAFGYFLFGNAFVKINLENCQILHDTFCIKIREDSTVPNRGETTPPLPNPSETPSHSQDSVQLQVSASIH